MPNHTQHAGRAVAFRLKPMTWDEGRRAVLTAFLVETHDETGRSHNYEGRPLYRQITTTETGLNLDGFEWCAYVERDDEAKTFELRGGQWQYMSPSHVEIVRAREMHKTLEHFERQTDRMRQEEGGTEDIGIIARRVVRAFGCVRALLLFPPNTVSTVTGFGWSEVHAKDIMGDIGYSVRRLLETWARRELDYDPEWVKAHREHYAGHVGY